MTNKINVEFDDSFEAKLVSKLSQQIKKKLINCTIMKRIESLR
jgi:hypothetical protein